MCPSVTPEALLNDKIKRERGNLMSKHRGRKRSYYIGTVKTSARTFLLNS